MTIAGLAREAGVSPQTVYNSVGGKGELIKAVYDLLLAGDEDPTPMSERPSFDAVVNAPDVTAYAHAYAQWTRDIYLRVGRLLGRSWPRGRGTTMSWLTSSRRSIASAVSGTATD